MRDALRSRIANERAKLISEPKMCHKKYLDKKIGGAVRVRVQGVTSDYLC